MALPDFSFENEYWKKGMIVAGCDEVGRGCFAGPVVAAAVVFSPHQKNIRESLSGIRINDSKKMTPKQRDSADIWIRKNAAYWGIGITGVNLINKLGIKKATEMAFRKAVAVVCSRVAVNFLLSDAFYIPRIHGLKRPQQIPIIKGDSKSFSIAAASIVAKVYRDKLMTLLSQKPQYSDYLWHKNKGYGTKEHGNAIITLGITKMHRVKFVETFLNNSSFSRA